MNKRKQNIYSLIEDALEIKNENLVDFYYEVIKVNCKEEDFISFSTGVLKLFLRDQILTLMSHEVVFGLESFSIYSDAVFGEDINEDLQKRLHALNHVLFSNNKIRMKIIETLRNEGFYCNMIKKKDGSEKFCLRLSFYNGGKLI